MPIVHMKDMLQHAYDHKYAVGAFDLVSLDFLQGILQGAEQAKAPVILSLAESHFEYFDFELLMRATVAAAKRASVPVAIHLDHGSSLDSAIQGIRYGCTGVMIDSSDKPLDENIRLTKAIVDMCQGCGIPVEGELGYVPGVEGEDAERHPGEVCYTTVEEAEKYIRETQVDFLAVSIGTVHGRMQGKPKLDIQRLQQINEALRIPLVIHGGTGLSDVQFQQLIQHGVTKINYYTALSDKAAGQIYANSQSQKQLGYTGLVENIPQVIAQEVERCIKIWGSDHQADAVLQTCQPWQEVEHLIVYNVSGISDQEALAMIAKGKEELAKIPGVLRVFTGKAMRDQDRYRYTWLVQFCHPNVIESYKHHPLHVAFADELFRPVAGDRISIDYQAI